MIGEGRGLARRLLLHAEPAIDDRKNVVRRQIVGIDRLQGLVLRSRLVVLMLLIKRESKLAMRIARARELGCYLSKISDGSVQMPLRSLNQREIVKRTRILRSKL